MVRTLGVLGLVAVAALGVAACGDDDDGGDAVVGEGGTVSESTEGGDGGDGEASVPDACDAIAADALSAAFGDVGAGESDSVVASRSVCIYESGVLVGVSEGNQFDGTVEIARDNAECSDVSGAGEEAVFCITGDTVGQLLWLDGDLMYDLTASSTDQDAFVEVANAVS